MKILSCGAGMQSTALALMSCENAIKGRHTHPLVPIYDLVAFCDLGHEPDWVYRQVRFIGEACRKVGIPFVVLYTGLYDYYMEKFGRQKSVTSIPFWSIGMDGSKAKMKRQCTIDFKILAIQRYVKFTLLGYNYAKRNTHNRPWDIGRHEMHIGFSAEENNRVFLSKHPFYVNRFPLIEMGLERPDNYRYCKEVWGLDTKASACAICPFHTNYFFRYIRDNQPGTYQAVLAMDKVLEERQPNTAIKSQLFISKSRKRIHELCRGDCMDAETFLYRGQHVWNAF